MVKFVGSAKKFQLTISSLTSLTTVQDTNGMGIHRGNYCGTQRRRSILLTFMQDAHRTNSKSCRSKSRRSYANPSQITSHWTWGMVGQDLTTIITAAPIRIRMVAIMIHIVMWIWLLVTKNVGIVENVGIDFRKPNSIRFVKCITRWHYKNAVEIWNKFEFLNKKLEIYLNALPTYGNMSTWFFSHHCNQTSALHCSNPLCDLFR